MSFEDTCREAARLGIKGYDLRGPADWPTLKKYGLVPSMYQPAGPDAASIPNALNRKENHERMDRSIRVLSMNLPRPVYRTSSHSQAIAELVRTPTEPITASRFEQHQSYAEMKGVRSAWNAQCGWSHGYMFDHMAWGVDVIGA
jgi:hydroxypyruvate isomerase